MWSRIRPRICGYVFLFFPTESSGVGVSVRLLSLGTRDCVEPGQGRLAVGTDGAFGSEVFDVAGGDVVEWIGVETQVPVVSVAKASFQLGPVVAAGLRTGIRRCASGRGGGERELV